MAEDIDQASANVILALHFQDIQDLKLIHAGGIETDQTIALQAYQDELELSTTTYRDHHMASLFGRLPLHDEQLPEVPPAIALTAKAAGSEEVQLDHGVEETRPETPVIAGPCII
ncbi:MAG: hypothetical protein Q9168_004187, partial [Polycauliona sp. 1 TL-2023]